MGFDRAAKDEEVKAFCVYVIRNNKKKKKGKGDSRNSAKIYMVATCTDKYQPHSPHPRDAVLHTDGHVPPTQSESKVRPLKFGRGRTKDLNPSK